MIKSENIGNLAKALAAVQSQLKPAVKDSKNPYFKSSYADLNSVWNACRDLLADNSLSVSQLPGTTADGQPALTTILMHESGEYIADTVILAFTKNDAQGIGSSLTYFRRYALAAVIGIVADDDDDGNAASGQGAAKQTAKPKPDDDSKKKELINRIEALAKTKEVDTTKIAYGVTNRTNNLNDLSVAELEKAWTFLQKK